MDEATQTFREANAGNPAALERLIPMVYDELRRRAESCLRAERSDHTLQATALVHETYLKLIDQERMDWRDRAHFCAIAARIMRRVLVEHARGRNAEKRGGEMEKLYLEETRELAGETSPDLPILDEALRNFADNYPREASVVEMKFFAGLDANEIATVLDVSQKTVLRDWQFAKLWLRRALAQNSLYA